MFFKFNSFFSPLKKYNFESYHLDSQESINNAKQDILSIANLLLEESIESNKKLRFEAGYLLSGWMSKNDDYSFGSGNLKKLFDDKVELAIVSMSAQIKYCLENEVNSSYDPKSRFEIWKMITVYIENPKNKVKLTTKLKQLIQAKNDGKLAGFLAENE